MHYLFDYLELDNNWWNIFSYQDLCSAHTIIVLKIHISTTVRLTCEYSNTLVVCIVQIHFLAWHKFVELTITITGTSHAHVSLSVQWDTPSCTSTCLATGSQNVVSLSSSLSLLSSSLSLPVRHAVSPVILLKCCDTVGGTPGHFLL